MWCHNLWHNLYYNSFMERHSSTNYNSTRRWIIISCDTKLIILFAKRSPTSVNVINFVLLHCCQTCRKMMVHDSSSQLWSQYTIILALKEEILKNILSKETNVLFFWCYKLIWHAWLLSLPFFGGVGGDGIISLSANLGLNIQSFCA